MNYLKSFFKKNEISILDIEECLLNLTDEKVKIGLLENADKMLRCKWIYYKRYYGDTIHCHFYKNRMCFFISFQLSDLKDDISTILDESKTKLYNLYKAKLKYKITNTITKGDLYLDVPEIHDNMKEDDKNKIILCVSVLIECESDINFPKDKVIGAHSLYFDDRVQE